MSIEDLRTVDVVSIDNRSGEVVLTVSDPFGWSNPAHHLQLLQAKLQSYVDFVESGELYARYPKTRDRRPRVDVVFFHPSPTAATPALERASSQLASANISLVFRNHTDARPPDLRQLNWPVRAIHSELNR